ncbi:MAG: DUF433 domain-containing protein [Segetibacter sp.]|jgi:uncharacterized protein (DUF433 family)|nr:DUF433 domain-containing protein [Segetibacter sp.]
MDKNTSELLSRITAISGLCGGRPTIRGMRIRVLDILEMLGSGMTETEILEDFPYLESEDIKASLFYAAKRLEEPVVYANYTDAV